MLEMPFLSSFYSYGKQTINIISFSQNLLFITQGFKHNKMQNRTKNASYRYQNFDNYFAHPHHLVKIRKQK